jgi:hypothetical protein
MGNGTVLITTPLPISVVLTSTRANADGEDVEKTVRSEVVRVAGITRRWKY